MPPRIASRPRKRSFLNIEVHREIRNRIGVKARESDLTMIQWFHYHFCEVFQRPDLIDEVPVPQAPAN